MINTKFYDGFEGEPELVLTDGENKLIIWYGYFETVLDSLLDNNLEKRGIIKEELLKSILIMKDGMMTHLGLFRIFV